MATVQSGPGRICLFNDFFCGLDQTDIAANTTTPDLEMAGPFLVFGEGTVELDSNLIHLNVLSGAVRFTSTATGDDPICVGTYNCFKIERMAPMTIEARVQFADLDTKRCFFGLTDADDGTNKKLLSIEDDIVAATGVAFTPQASDYVGFYYSSEMTAPDDEDWHAMFRGGTESQTTVSTTYDLGIAQVAADWQILRLEVDPNGTARWWHNGILKYTRTGACATDVALGVVLGVEGTAGSEDMDVDYLLVEATRDWTV